MRSCKIIVLTTLIAVGLAVPTLAATYKATKSPIICASVSSRGVMANKGSGGGALSADGRFVVFTSEADNLVPNDTNKTFDAFVYDRITGKTERISVASDGTEGNEKSSSSTISADGRYVAFTSAADNLVPDDKNKFSDVFIHDRQTGKTERISMGFDGKEANGDCGLGGLVISGNGQVVAFISRATNLVPGDTNNQVDTFAYDRQIKKIERVSVSTDGTQGDGESFEYGIAINNDGNYIAFVSLATNLVSDDGYPNWDVFVRDRKNKTTELISVAPDGRHLTQLNGHASISADGRYVVFASQYSPKAEYDYQNWDVYVRDRVAGTTELVSVAPNGQRAKGANGFYVVAISADGNTIGYDSDGSNIVPGDTNQQYDVFVYDRSKKTTERVSLSENGSEGNAFSGGDGLFLNSNGRYVSFVSHASNLVSGDKNDVKDIFILDRFNSQKSVVAEPTEPQQENEPAPEEIQQPENPGEIDVNGDYRYQQPNGNYPPPMNEAPYPAN